MLTSCLWTSYNSAWGVACTEKTLNLWKRVWVHLNDAICWRRRHSTGETYMQWLNNIVHMHLSCFPDVGLTRPYVSWDVFCRNVVENKVLLAALLSHVQVSSRIWSIPGLLILHEKLLWKEAGGLELQRTGSVELINPRPFFSCPRIQGDWVASLFNLRLIRYQWPSRECITHCCLWPFVTIGPTFILVSGKRVSSLLPLGLRSHWNVYNATWDVNSFDQNTWLSCCTTPYYRFITSTNSKLLVYGQVWGIQSW